MRGCHRYARLVLDAGSLLHHDDLRVCAQGIDQTSSARLEWGIGRTALAKGSCHGSGDSEPLARNTPYLCQSSSLQSHEHLRHATKLGAQGS